MRGLSDFCSSACQAISFIMYISLEDFCGFDFEYLNIISGDDSSFKATRRGSGLNISGGSPDPDELKKGVVSIGVKKVKDMVDSIPSGGGKDDSVSASNRMMGDSMPSGRGKDDSVSAFNRMMGDSIPSDSGKDDSVSSLCDLDDRVGGYGPGNSTVVDDKVEHFNDIVDLNIRGIEANQAEGSFSGSDESGVENTAIANYSVNRSTSSKRGRFNILDKTLRASNVSSFLFGSGFQDRGVRSKSLLSSGSGDELNDVNNSSRDLEPGSPPCKVVKLK